LRERLEKIERTLGKERIGMIKYNLLIWELVPEDTYLYLLPVELGNELLAAASNCFFNHSDLNEEQEYALDQINLLLDDDWAQYKTLSPIKLNDNQSIIGAYLCGFIL
jgi:hypothetical protein